MMRWGCFALLSSLKIGNPLNSVVFAMKKTFKILNTASGKISLATIYDDIFKYVT